ncbi:MAG: RNA-binding protein [Smithellaceae bacterium]|nr:RNA-binding protein [Smithellaceae bacterium]
MQGAKLYVGNLSYSVTGEQLRELFSAHGTVESAKVIEGKGFGFVEMGSQAEAEAARKALDGSNFNGRPLKVNEARTDRGRDSRPRHDYRR